MSSTEPVLYSLTYISYDVAKQLVVQTPAQFCWQTSLQRSLIIYSNTFLVINQILRSRRAFLSIVGQFDFFVSLLKYFESTSLLCHNTHTEGIGEIKKPPAD